MPAAEREGGLVMTLSSVHDDQLEGRIRVTPQQQEVSTWEQQQQQQQQQQSSSRAAAEPSQPDKTVSGTVKQGGLVEHNGASPTQEREAGDGACVSELDGRVVGNERLSRASRPGMQWNGGAAVGASRCPVAT